MGTAALSTFQARTRDCLGDDQQTVQWDDVRETLETIERFGREVLAKGTTQVDGCALQYRPVMSGAVIMTPERTAGVPQVQRRAS